MFLEIFLFYFQRLLVCFVTWSLPVFGTWCDCPFYFYKAEDSYDLCTKKI